MPGAARPQDDPEVQRVQKKMGRTGMLLLLVLAMAAGATNQVLPEHWKVVKMLLTFGTTARVVMYFHEVGKKRRVGSNLLSSFAEGVCKILNNKEQQKKIESSTYVRNIINGGDHVYTLCIGWFINLQPKKKGN
jgi:hypothetical protein